MGAAITYLLVDLEGVDTEPDILENGKKGPWTIFTNADCSEQFKNKHGENITLTFMGHPLEFTVTYGDTSIPTRVALRACMQTLGLS